MENGLEKVCFGHKDFCHGGLEAKIEVDDGADGEGLLWPGLVQVIVLWPQ